MNMITSQIIPLPHSHVDTDQIIPAEFLRATERKGFGEHLFAHLRTNDLEFPLNKQKYQNGKILVAGKNFGCGSSREHAVWALIDWGIKAIVAPSFADIFYANALNNHLLPIVLNEEEVAAIFQEEKTRYPYELTINLADQSVCLPDGKIHTFQIEPYRKECLLNQMDDMDYLLSKLPQIQAFEKNHPHFIDSHILFAKIRGRSP